MSRVLAVLTVEVDEPNPKARDIPSGTLSPTRTRALLGLYGVVLAAVFVVAASAVMPSKPVMLSSRATGVRAAQQVLDAGGPPLAVRHGSSYSDPNAADDQGLYLYLPVLGRITGREDPHRTLKLFWLILFGVTLAVAPLTWLAATGSLRAAVVVPLALAVLIASMGGADIYWIVPWALLTFLPLVLAAARVATPRRALPLLVVAGFGASFATSIRSAAGLPVAIAALFVVLTRAWPWRARAALAAATVIAFVAITPIGFDGLRAYRNNDVHFVGLQGTSHPFWHSTYIGLGFLPNKWGLRYLDEDGIAAARRVEPAARYPSARYNAVERRLYSRAFRHDPGFVAGETAQKAVAMIGHAAPYLLVAVLALLMLRALGSGLTGPHVMIAAPALVVSLVPPLASVPYRPYELGLFAAIGLIALFAITRILALPIQSRREARARFRAIGWRGPLLASGATLVTLVGFGFAASRIDKRSDTWQQHTPTGREPLP